MGALSNYLEARVLDHTLAGVPYAPPAAHYVSLHTADPGEAGSTAAEVTGGGYQRALATFSAAVNGQTANSNTLAYPNMPALTVTHVGIWDAPTGGNLLYYGALVTPVAVTAGGTFVVNAGGLTVALD